MYIKLAYGALGLTIAVAILSAIDLFKLVLYKKVFKKESYSWGQVFSAGILTFPAIFIVFSIVFSLLTHW